MEGVMYIYSKHYRYQAAECLKASLEAREPLRREFQISMALSWLSLARRDEAMDHAVPTPSGMAAKSAQA
jgi:hypothetical protein